MKKTNGKTTTEHPTAEARIQSIGRAKALLDAMAGGEWIGLRDLAAETGLVKTTAFNLVNALADVGLVERDAEAGAYRLGLHLLVYGRSVERRLDIISIAKPHLVRLCAETRETVNLALPGPADATIVESLEGSHNLRVTSYSGTSASYHATACGRALLAYQPEGFRRYVYATGSLAKRTERTIVEAEELERLLADCRARGWTSEMEENEPGSACIAAPIFDATGKAVASVSVAGPAARFQPNAIEQLAGTLLQHLSRINEELGRAAPQMPAAARARTGADGNAARRAKDAAAS